MLRLVLAVLTLTAGLSVAAAETPPSIAPGVPSGSGTQPVAVYGADGKVVSFPDPARIRVTTMPFQRLHSLPIRLKTLSTTPKVFPVSRPADATTYRVVVPCNVNIRLLGAKTADEVLTDDNGVLYLAGTDVTMGTSKPDFIIAKTTAPPDGDCTPEMHYGMGGG
jgi:hypothetical protein